MCAYWQASVDDTAAGMGKTGGAGVLQGSAAVGAGGQAAPLVFYTGETVKTSGPCERADECLDLFEAASEQQ